MTIKADIDSLAADGTALFDWQAAEPPPATEPASAHPVDVGVSGQLNAHSASLGLLINHAQQVRAEGGAATLNTAAMLRGADEAGADVIAGRASTSGAVSAPIALASVSAPVLPEIPAMPSLLPPVSGEVHSALVYNGPGSASYRNVGDYWQTQAAALENIAGDTTGIGGAIQAHWFDGQQQAGANTAAYGTWLSGLAGHARTLAAAHNEAADHHDRHVAATPNPQEFTAAHQQLQQATTVAQQAAAAAHLSQLHGQALDAAAAHQAASSATTSGIPAAPGTAPNIANGGCPGGSGTQSGNGSADPLGLGQLGSQLGQLGSQLGLTSGQGAAGTGAGGTNSMMQSLMQSLPMLGMMAPMAMMAPMSALSGLGGMGKSTTPTALTAQTAGLPDAMAADAGLSPDVSDTMPAASGGGGLGAGVGAAPLPTAGPAAPSPTAVSGPASSVLTAAEGAPTAPASVGGGGGTSMMPPMMGAPGAGDAGSARDMRLFPDRRMVWRPVPNAEAVFGELPRERRPRAKRGKPEESANEGSEGGQK